MTNQNVYTAILTKATDYRDSDKLVRLFTVESGVITAVMKGVKKAGAKLKYAAQPFAFCEYTIVEKNGFNTVIGCMQIEDLFNLAQDYDKYIYAAVMLEAADAAAFGQANPALFSALLRAFKELLYSDTDPVVICGKFLSLLLGNAGFIREDTIPPLAQIIDADIKRLARKVEESYNIKLNALRLLF